MEDDSAGALGPNPEPIVHGMRRHCVVLEAAPRFVDVGNGEGHDGDAGNRGEDDVLEPGHDVVDARDLDRALVERESQLTTSALFAGAEREPLEAVRGLVRDTPSRG